MKHGRSTVEWAPSFPATAVQGSSLDSPKSTRYVTGAVYASLESCKRSNEPLLSSIVPDSSQSQTAINASEQKRHCLHVTRKVVRRCSNSKGLIFNAEQIVIQSSIL